MRLFPVLAGAVLATFADQMLGLHWTAYAIMIAVVLWSGNWLRN